MIRPVTIATCLLACGAGLYLYQSKHEVEVLDRKIEQTVQATKDLREKSRMLAAEWTMLNDPERLQQFSATYLAALKPISPTQFTSLAELDHRLPAPVTPPPPSQGTTDEPDTGPAVSENTPAGGADTEAGSAVVAAASRSAPQATVPVAAPSVAPVRHAETRVAERAPVVHRAVREAPAHPVVLADARPVAPRFVPRVAEPRPEMRAAEPRPEMRVASLPPLPRAGAPAAPNPIVLGAPRPMPVMAQTAPAPVQYRPPSYAPTQPYGGSFLGMARGSMPSAPRPTPVNTAYNAD